MGEYSFIVDIYIYVYHMNRIKLLYRCVSSHSYICEYVNLFWTSVNLIAKIGSDLIEPNNQYINIYIYNYILKNRFTTRVSTPSEKFSFCLLSLYLFYFIVSPLLSFYIQDSHPWMHNWASSIFPIMKANLINLPTTESTK